MTPPLLIGNWKSHTTFTDAQVLVKTSITAKEAVGDAVSIGIAPPFPWLMSLHSMLNDSGVLLGAQNCSATGTGAFTGEVAASMLQECVSFIIVGHSERRALYGETDNVVHEKLIHILEQGVTAVLCVGEVLEERQAGDAQSVVRRQLLAALEDYPHDQLAKLIIAYEPVWAIGTGISATADDAEEMCAYIRALLNERFGDSSAVVIQYGGSANENNAAELLAQPHVGGLLIGGASLKPEAFTAMITAAAAK